jgi:hypothetical protein
VSLLLVHLKRSMKATSPHGADSPVRLGPDRRGAART